MTADQLAAAAADYGRQAAAVYHHAYQAAHQTTLELNPGLELKADRVAKLVAEQALLRHQHAAFPRLDDQLPAANHEQE